MRLACVTKVLGDMEVETGPELDSVRRQFLQLILVRDLRDGYVKQIIAIVKPFLAEKGPRQSSAGAAGSLERTRGQGIRAPKELSRPVRRKRILAGVPAQSRDLDVG